jgi:cytochrome P450
MQTLLILYAAANRDPERFECPDEFWMGRDNVQKHVAWGHGAPLLPRRPVARTQGRIAFERLFTRLDDIRAAPSRNDFTNYRTMYFGRPTVCTSGFNEPWSIRSACRPTGRAYSRRRRASA